MGSLSEDDPLIKGIYTHAAAYNACQDTELVAVKETLVVRIPWAEDYNGKSVVDLKSLQVKVQQSVNR